MIEMCISGVPGTGKTSLCRYLADKGLQCHSADEIALRVGCMDGETVDVDCLNSRISDLPVVEGHYSHLLQCRRVLILTCREDILEKRLAERGYSLHKIMENLDVQRSGTIYFEALDRLPSTMIREVDTSCTDLEHTADIAMRFMLGEGI